MGEITSGVSWTAVLVGAVVAFLMGWLWYSPKLFGEKWAAGSGIKMGSGNTMPMAAMASQVIGLLLMSWFVGVTANSNALYTVILATVAFVVLQFSANSFSGKSDYAKYVDAGYWLASLVIMIICQGVVRKMTM